MDEMERQGEKQAAATAWRHELVATIEEARRVKREDIPALRPRIEELHTEWQDARIATEAALRRWGDLSDRSGTLGLDANATIDCSQNILRQTADPRLRDMAEKIHDECVNWRHTWERLVVRETVGQFMEAYTRIDNQDELDALHRRLKDAEAALDGVLLLPDPEENDVVRVLDQAQAAIDMIERNTGRRGGGR